MPKANKLFIFRCGINAVFVACVVADHWNPENFQTEPARFIAIVSVVCLINMINLL